MTPKAMGYPVVDFLAEEEKREQKRAKREAKKVRVRTLVKNLTTTQPEPIVDFLAFGD